MFRKFKKLWKKFIDDDHGALMVAFAIMAPVIVAAAGMSMDYAQAYLVKQRMAQAIDSAALAAGASSTDEDVIRQKVLDFFEANYPEDKIGFTIDPEVTVTGNEIHVSGTAYYYTTFMRIVGVEEITVEAETTVQRAVQGIEVVLVMDNTGSMSSNNNIATLRTAANNFVCIMYGIDTEECAEAEASALDGLATHDRNYIKIGLVPYSTSVNVGPHGLGLNSDGTSYGTAFVNNPHDLEYDTSDSDAWHGCVLANDNPDDTADNEGPWDMYRYCLDGDEDIVCDYSWQGKKKKKYKVANRNPNYICPRTPITPLSTSPSDLRTAIDTMRANGHTLGNFGMVWGYRVVSPDFPFEEASPYDSEYYKKAVVMMTDGVNTMHNHYSAYGPTNDHNIDAGDLNERFEDVCENMKEDGILIYTITFEGGVNEWTKNYYRNCATSEDYYHDAPTQTDLVNVFETISRELSNLYIKY